MVSQKLKSFFDSNKLIRLDLNSKFYILKAIRKPFLISLVTPLKC